jgi:signal peptidase I
MPPKIRQLLHAVGWIVGVAFVVVLLGTVVVPRAAGWQTFVVTSGSMEPTLPVGSVVAVQPVDVGTIESRDIITFHQHASTEVITHRVIEWEGDMPDRVFLTAGDANDQLDPSPVPAEAVIGVVRIGVPYIGYVTSWITTPIGVGVAAALVAFALLGGGSNSNDRKRRPRHLATTEEMEEEGVDEPAALR